MTTNYNLLDILLELVCEGKTVEEMSKYLNLGENYIKEMLEQLKNKLIATHDSNCFHYVKLINKLIKVKKSSHNIFNKKEHVELYKMLVEGRHATYIMERLHMNPPQYISYLKRLYKNIFEVGDEEDIYLLTGLERSIEETKQVLSKRSTKSKKDSKVECLNERVIINKNNIHEELESISGQVYDTKSSSIKFIVISDTHFGSYFENLDYLEEVYEYASNNDIRYIFHCGDLIEGDYSNYERCKREYRTIESQVEHILDDYCYDQNITNVILLGNHDISSFIFDDIDIEPLLHERKDFVSLGYRNGYIKVDNEYITLKHNLSKVLNSMYTKGTFINLTGHSHIFNAKFNDRNFRFKVPTLSDMQIPHSITNNGFLVGELIIDGNEKYIKMQYIDLMNRSRVLTLESTTK